LKPGHSWENRPSATGGYPNTPWDKWDAAVADFERERRAAIRAEIDGNNRRK
jgi:hypothetical protein